jgi:hypothetical protein
VCVGACDEIVPFEKDLLHVRVCDSPSTVFFLCVSDCGEGISAFETNSSYIIELVVVRARFPFMCHGV